MGLSLGDLFLALLLWEIVGALVMAYGFWTKGLDDYFYQQDMKTYPTFVDHTLAVLILGVSLIIFAYLPLTKGENLTQELLPALAFSMAVWIGQTMRIILSERKSGYKEPLWVTQDARFVLAFFAICVALWLFMGFPVAPEDISW